MKGVPLSRCPSSPAWHTCTPIAAGTDSARMRR